jgi:hypothetical protein
MCSLTIVLFSGWPVVYLDLSYIEINHPFVARLTWFVAVVAIFIPNYNIINYPLYHAGHSFLGSIKNSASGKFSTF